jgi:hypothetical protein
MVTTVDTTPLLHRQEVRDDVYNMFNVAAAAILDRLDPEPTHSYSTSLTERAILKAENEIIEADYQAIKNAPLAQKVPKSKPVVDLKKATEKKAKIKIVINDPARPKKK